LCIATAVWIFQARYGSERSSIASAAERKSFTRALIVLSGCDV